jgi:hypothetical protein
MRRSLGVAGMAVLLCVCVARADDPNAYLTLSADANWLGILKGGTTPVRAVVGNQTGAGGSLDWSVDNNGVTGLTLSGSNTGLAPGSTATVAGSYTCSAYGTYSVSARATGTNTTGGGPAMGSPAISNVLSVNVGQAVAANSEANDLNAFDRNLALCSLVSAGGSYAGLASKVVSGAVHTEFSEATILYGTNTSGDNQVVSMNWRTGRPSSTGPPTPTRRSRWSNTASTATC